MSTDDPTNGRTATEPRPHGSRRCVLGATVTVVGAGLAGCTGTLGSENSQLEDQLETVREATEPYTDPRAALSDGFTCDRLARIKAEYDPRTSSDTT